MGRERERGAAGVRSRFSSAPLLSRAPRLSPSRFFSFSPPSQEYIGKLASSQAKGDDYETAAAQIGVEVYSAMSAAVGTA
jgi:hypothetical protein